MTASVQIYVLSRDRPDYLRQTLDSVAAQDMAGIDVIVSDNSAGDEIENLMARHYPHLRYVRRRPTLSALSHFRVVIEESTGEYVAFFHDDDLMESNYVSSLVKAMEEDPALAAVGCNAGLLLGEAKTAKTLMGVFPSALRVETAEDLLRPYMAITAMRPAPFPSYLYRRKHLAGLFLDPSQGGKYSDVSFLMKLVARAPIKWLPTPLMWYRVHASNDSVAISMGQIMSLRRFIQSRTTIGPHSRLMSEYRFRCWMNWWRSYRRTRSRATPWRARIVSRYLLGSACRWALTRPALWVRFLAQVR